ncbi:MAG: RidA family protein [Pseudomonadota bacterium]
MTRKIIETATAPKAIGTYSQAVQIGDMLFLSGQVGLDPNTMQMVSDDVTEQCHQVFKNLIAVLHAAKYDVLDVVKLTVYLKDLNHFAAINEVMAMYFTTPYPARAAIEISRLPKDALVEIDAIAVKGE